MSIRKKDKSFPSGNNALSTEAIPVFEWEFCNCPLASSRCLLTDAERDVYNGDEEHSPFIPVHAALNEMLRSRLQQLLASCATFSIILLHISQLEQTYITPEMAVVPKRHRYHPLPSILEQVMVNVRRAIRRTDEVYVDAGRGAAIILPDVEQQGAHKIIERIYNNVSLLQGETLIPPLTHETEIVLGVGSYPGQGVALEQVLVNASRVFHRFTLRAAITTRLWETMPSIAATVSMKENEGSQDYDRLEHNNEQGEVTGDRESSLSAHVSTHNSGTIPYLQLPTILPARLKALVTHKVATRFRCVPVGRDHQRLTVAMADPTNSDAIQELQATTHMTIFPVACSIEALDALLDTGW